MTTVSADNYKAITSGNAKAGRSDGPFIRESDDALVMLENADEVWGSMSGTCVIEEDFLGAGLNVTDSIWRITDTSAAGTPTYAIKADKEHGEFEIAFDNTNEAQIVTLSTNDELNVDSQNDPVFVARFLVDATLNANDSLVIGLAGAQNDTLDSVAQHAWFRIEGANTSLLVETDDGTTDNDDNDSTFDLTAGTHVEVKIDMSDTSNVKFYYRETLAGAWTRILEDEAFDVSAYTGNYQPFVQFQKSSGTQTTGMRIDYIRCTWKRD